MNIYTKVRESIISATIEIVKQNSEEAIDFSNIVVEIPNDPSNGEISTNAAMVLAKPLKSSPKIIADSIKKIIESDALFSSVTIAPNDFINIVLQPQCWADELATIIRLEENYGKSTIGKGKSVNVEFASPNPTGPMHVGHARGAIYGDVLSSLLEYVGYKVVREYYVNDAGNQMLLLVKSILIRYLELCGKYKEKFPEGCYPGSYIIDAARVLKRQYANQLLDIDEEHRNSIIRDFAVEFMMNMIKTDLRSIGIVHDVFFYESLLHKENKIEQLVEILQKKNLVYKGILEQPKGSKASAEWEEREQLLFRTTDFGDNADRPLQKSNGEWTYFAADVAYLNNKLLRGFAHLILVLGADHIGYQKRMQAACESLNNGVSILDIKLCQLVLFLKDGKPFKMSKRSGNFLSISQIIRAIGKDVLRFMMVTRKNDVIMELDFIKVKDQSKDNPLFYVQYAHSRAHSVLANALEQCKAAVDFNISKVNLSLLNTQAELELVRYLSYWPRQVEVAANTYEPHRIALYLQNLAALFHSFWNKGKDQQELRFIIQSDIELTAARLTLVKATINIIRNGLNLIGIAALDKM